MSGKNILKLITTKEEKKKKLGRMSEEDKGKIMMRQFL